MRVKIYQINPERDSNRMKFMSLSDSQSPDPSIYDEVFDVVYPDDNETCIICNEEGKLIGMEGNRRIGDGSSIIAGPFFICGTTEEDFRGLTDSEVDLYMDRFKEPEQISPEEVRADTGCTIIFSM